MTVTDRDGFYRAAMEILARDGRDGLRIGTLCKAVGVTTGSFHHRFAGWPGFVDYLLERWEQEEAVRLREIAARSGGGIEHVAVLRSMALAFPHDAEAAIRSWAHLDPAVAAVQRRVDAEREGALCDAMVDLVPDPAQRRTRASLALAVLIGFQQRQSVAEAPGLDELFAELVLLQGFDQPPG